MATYIIGAVVFAIIGLAAYGTFRSRKKGSGCGCGCEGCDKSSGCH